MPYNSPYDVLVPWCQQPENVGLSNDEWLTKLQEKTITKVISRFGSFRTMAALLTPDEYATVRSTLDAVSASSPMLADMVAMLKLPGDSSGNGGGLDFGDPVLRGMLSDLVTATIATKLKQIAEIQVSQLDVWGLPIAAGNLVSARQIIEQEALNA